MADEVFSDVRLAGPCRVSLSQRAGHHPGNDRSPGPTSGRAGGGWLEPGLSRAIGKISLATVGMGFLLWSIMPFVPRESTWLPGLVGIGLGGIGYVLFAHLIGLDELTVIRRRLLKR